MTGSGTTKEQTRVTAISLKIARFVRQAALPLLVAIPALFWVFHATYRATLTPLGRDQGIFQYTAWAALQGDRLYRDVRDVNGPLTHLVHVIFLKLGGADPHRFRVLDALVTSIAFTAVGAALPGLVRGKRASPLERWAWGFAGWIVLSGAQLAYGYWDLAQRESFFDWFLLGSIALGWLAQGRTRSLQNTHIARRSTKALFVACGALSAIPWFGKPTYFLFSLFQVAGLLIDDDPRLTRRARIGLFAAGTAVGSVFMLACLAWLGDVGAYLRIVTHDVPTMYRFIWLRSADDIFSNDWFANQAILGLAGTLVMLVMLALKELPRRALAVALLPIGGIVNVVVQAKGFPYHFQPLTAGHHLQWLVLALWAVERFASAPVAKKHLRLIPLLACGLLSLRVATDMEGTPHIRASWLVWRGATPERRLTRTYFDSFPETDFFSWDLFEGARYLKEHTADGERVQTYGMDPYVLFLAGRLSATPYIYAYDLDVDSALAGSTGGLPDEAQAEAIRAMKHEHETDLLSRLKRKPPAAFVFHDKAPLMSQEDAWLDFEVNCPEAAQWTKDTFEESARFGSVRIWLRRDRAR